METASQEPDADPAVAGGEALLRAALGAMDARRVIGGVLAIGTSAFMVSLYVFKLDPEVVYYTTGTKVLGVVVCGWFLLAGGRWLVQVATRRVRTARLLRLLNEHPERVARIYGSWIGRKAIRHRIQPPELEHMPPASGGFLVTIEMAEPNRLRRLFSLHRQVVLTTREQLAPLLAYLRALAPDAQGPR
jgi:hypothetical protein